MASQPLDLLCSKILRLFVFLLFIHNVESFGRKKCTDSSECNQPLYEEFCDIALEACMSCAPYCTGSPEKERNCAEHCLKRHADVFGNHKPLSVPEPKVSPLKENPAPAEEPKENNDLSDVPKALPMKEDTAEEPKENTDSDQDDDGSGNVVAVVVVILVVVIMIAVVAIRRYQRPERGYQQGRLDAEDPRSQIDVNSNEDIERINENTDEPDIRVDRTPDQADPLPSEQAQFVSSVSRPPDQTLTDIDEIKEHKVRTASLR